jgi:hypothetical protein
MRDRDAVVTTFLPQPGTPPDVLRDQTGAALEDTGRLACSLKYPTVLEDIMNDIMELKLTLPTMTDELEGMPAIEYGMRDSERIFASSSCGTLNQILLAYLPERKEADALLFSYLQGELVIQPFVR